MGIYRQKRDDNSNAGHRRKDGKKQDPKDFFIKPCHFNMVKTMSVNL